MSKRLRLVTALMLTATVITFAGPSPHLAAAQAQETPDSPITEEETAAEEDAPLTDADRQRLAGIGKTLATERCETCHATGKNDQSNNTEAPPLRDFAAKWPLETLEESLAEGIVTGHEEMPEFVFEPDEITAFLEYLRTLSQ